MFIGSTTSTAVFMSPLTIAMEISKNENRALIAMFQCVSWTMALCFLPALMWIVGDWKPFMLITTLPCAIFLFSNRLVQTKKIFFTLSLSRSYFKALLLLIKYIYVYKKSPIVGASLNLITIFP